MTKLFAGALLGLAILFAACDPVGLSGTDQTTIEPRLSPLATTSHMATSATEYEVIDLGSFGGNNNVAWAINDAGHVAGRSQKASGEFRAFLWDAVDGMQDLGTFGGYTTANEINNAGQVVGFSQLASGESRAFLWDESGGMQNLGELLGEPVTRPVSWNSEANAINELGQVVGVTTVISIAPGSDPELPTYGLGRHAVLWDASTGIRDLGTLTGPKGRSEAKAINEAGQVVGISYNASRRQHAFIWDEAGGMRDLGTLGGIFSDALDINESGQVVGRSLTDFSENHAFIWDETGGMRDLGTLGGNFSQAYAINDLGQVVGYSKLTSGESRAFLWDEVSGMRELNHLDGNFSVALDINESGQIAGFIRDENYKYRAVLWNPVQNADTTPPEIAFETIKTSLWPPNHKMHLVLSGISATDDSDENPTVNVSVTSNELLNGLGDGNTAEDWEVVQTADGSYEVYLRAERSGKGSGRVYTVTVTAEDASGNMAEELIEVNVARDMGRSNL